MENLKQLKETAEVRILSVCKTLENLQCAYGIEKLGEALSLLQEVRRELMVDLDDFLPVTEQEKI